MNDGGCMTSFVKKIALIGCLVALADIMVSLLHIQLIPAPAFVLFLFQCLDFIASLPLQFLVSSMGETSGSIGFAVMALFANASVWALLLTLGSRLVGSGSVNAEATSVVSLDPYGSSLTKSGKKAAHG